MLTSSSFIASMAFFTESAAVGVACHEAGHAIQHAQGYKPMWLRSALVPTANIGSSMGYIVMIGGLILQSANAIYLGAVLFSALSGSASSWASARAVMSTPPPGGRRIQ